MTYTAEIVEACVPWMFEPWQRPDYGTAAPEPGMPRAGADPRRALDFALPIIDTSRAWDRAGLSVDHKRVVLLRAMGFSWARISRIDGLGLRSGASASALHAEAVGLMVDYLNDGPLVSV